MSQTIQMSLKRERNEHDHKQRNPYAAAERPCWWVLVWREVVVEGGDDVRDEALDDDQVTVSYLHQVDDKSRYTKYQT